MRKFLALALPVALAACGDGETDFTVDVAMTTGEAQSRLMALDGGALPGAVGLAPVRVTNPEPGQLHYAFLDEDGGESGTLVFTIEGIDGGRSRIHTALDLAAVNYEIDGVSQVLSETLAENLLEQNLRDWAEDVSAIGYGSLDEVNATIAIFAIAMRPDRMAALDDPASAFAWMEGDAFGESGGFADDATFGDGGWAGDAPAYEADTYDDDFKDEYATAEASSWDEYDAGY